MIGRFGSHRDILVHAAVALFFSLVVVARLAGLGSYPDGLVDSESDVVGAVSDITGGQLVGLWSEAAGGQPTGFVYWLAGWSSIVGEGDDALRLMSAWVGLAAIGMFYVYCRAAFGGRAAVLGSMLMAVSIWHVGYSRLALPVGSLVLLQLGSSYLLLVAMRSEGRGRRFAAAGAVFGASVYTHNAFYIFAIAVGLWWAREFLAGEHAMGEVMKKCATFLAVAFVVATPYLWSAAAHSDEIGDRVSAIDLSSTEEYIEQPGLMEQTRFAMRRIVTTGAGLFVRTDQDDGPTRRLLDPVAALLAFAGLAAGLWRWRQREFFHIWSTVVAAVVVVGLTRDDGMYGRLIVALPAVYAASGYAFDGLLGLMRGRVSATASLIAVGLIVTAAGAYNVVAYYDTPIGREDAKWARVPFELSSTRTSASVRKRRGRGSPDREAEARPPIHAKVAVRVQPRARRNDVSVDDDGRVRVYVTAPADEGRANAAAVKLVADRLGVAPGRISIVGGQTSRDKLVRVEDAKLAAVLARLKSGT
jgi:hypothetical protein